MTQKKKKTKKATLGIRITQNDKNELTELSDKRLESYADTIKFLMNFYKKSLKKEFNENEEEHINNFENEEEEKNKDEDNWEQFLSEINYVTRPIKYFF